MNVQKHNTVKAPQNVVPSQYSERATFFCCYFNINQLRPLLTLLNSIVLYSSQVCLHVNLTQNSPFWLLHPSAENFKPGVRLWTVTAFQISRFPRTYPCLPPYFPISACNNRRRRSHDLNSLTGVWDHVGDWQLVLRWGGGGGLGTQ